MLRRRQNTINTNVFLGNRTSTFLYEPTTELDLIIRRNATINGNLTIGQDFRAKNIYASGNYYLDNYILIPAGTVIQSASETTPDGWLDCNGQELSKFNYSNLFLSIGTKYGGSATTFNLPDLRGRCVIGLGQGTGLTDRVLGSSGGEERHTLIENEMPSHTHTSNAIGGQGNVGLVTADGSETVTEADSSSGELNVWNVPIALSINDTGGDQPHNNMQPFLTLRFLIKY
jgi:microcystin-dependent protein